MTSHGSEWPKPLTAPDFSINTSPEGDAILRAISDGRTGRHWTSDIQSGTRVHRFDKNASHYVKLTVSDDERTDGLDTLERFTDELDADGTFALLYVSRLLAPPSPLPPNTLAAGWIDLDDVASKIWPKPRSNPEREARRFTVFRYLLFGDRALIVGKRPGKPYRVPATREEIPTRIDGSIWRFMDKELAIDVTLSLFPYFEVPLRVELAVSRDWSRLTSHPNLAQYLPLGELLGAIPGNKPSGAWARVIGLALANAWRRDPHSALEGKPKLTRSELLTRYLPKSSPPEALLTGANPVRAVTYWREALAMLVHNGFLTRAGEAALSEQQMKSALKGYRWQEKWLRGIVDLRPGPAISPTVDDRTASLPACRPIRLHNMNRPSVRDKRATQR